MKKAVLPAELLSLAKREGHSWAAAALLKMASEGRAVVGGWPHTMPEARARIVHALGSVAARSEIGRGEIDRATYEELARATYGFARTHWLQHAGREPAL